MGDRELENLGVTWQGEEDMRMEVAATVAAQATEEAAADQRAIRKAWQELEAAQDEIVALEDVDGNSRDAAYHRKVRSLNEQITKLAGAVKRLQVQAELHKAERSAKMRDAVAAEETMRHNAAVSRQRHDEAVLRNELKKEEDKTEQQQGSSTLQLLRERPLSHAMPVDPAHVRGTAETSAVQDYRGGDLLSSVHQVVVERTRSAHHPQKYLDDGDITLYEARCRKRQLDEEESGEDSRNAVVALSDRFRIREPVWSGLLDYQRVGVRWLLALHARNTGGILGDEMGLGKTIQVAALLCALCDSGCLHGPVLIVAPLTVLSQWVDEMHRWCPDTRSIIMHASGTSVSTREQLLLSVRHRPDVILTTYAAVHQHLDLLTATDFSYIILDEGHKICNPEANITLACKAFATHHRLILTGSPIQNTLKELWCLFDFVVPGLLGDIKTFTREFEEPITASRNPRASPLTLATAVECAKALRGHIAPHLLRRLKRDVNTMLPPKHERVIRCSLTDEQLAAYVDIVSSPDVQHFLSRALLRPVLDRHGRDESGAIYSGVSERGGMSPGMARQAFAVLSTLRQLCNHVDLWRLKMDDRAEGGSGKDVRFRSNNAVNIQGSGKLKTLLTLLQHWKPQGHKVLIFSQLCIMLDIIENMVDQNEFRYIRLDGQTASKNRALLIDKFNNDPSIFVALMTTRVGGLGVNLTGADRVVIFDPDWNPITDDQARERAWRIGQTREVCIYRMITSGTVEEHILHRQLAKTYVTEKVLNSPTLQRFFSINTLSQAFLLGSEYTLRVPEKARFSVINHSLGDIVGEVDHQLPYDGGNDEAATEETTAATSPTDAHETSLLSTLVDGGDVTVVGPSVPNRNEVGLYARAVAQRTLQRAIRPS